MIKLKFQENPRISDWGYVPNFTTYGYSVEEGESIRFCYDKLSDQSYDDIVKFSDFIKKFEDFTLIAHTDCSNSINAKKLIEIADQVYIGSKLIKDIKETTMSDELRIPEDQMQLSLIHI